MKTKDQSPPQDKWGPFDFGDGQRVFDIRYDPVFKAVFTRDTEESRCALSHLVSALIGRAVTVQTIIANEPATDYLGGKKIRFDIACKSKDGEPIDVEMSFLSEISDKKHYPSKNIIRVDYVKSIGATT